MQAARFGKNPEVLNVLIKAGADTNAKNNKGETALDLAKGKPEFESVLKAKDTSPRAPISAEDFFKLCQSGTPQEVEAAIKAGADANAKDALYGWTPLIFATLNNKNPEVVSVLIRGGADANFKMENGLTVLMYAAVSGSAEVLNALIQGGSDVNAKDNMGRTLLTFAAEKNVPEIVSLLLASGATVSESDVEQA